MNKKYSGKQVIKAGEWLRDNSATDNPADFDSAMDTLSYWRFSHEVPLENALKTLQQTTLKIDESAIFAKRLKRHVSIVNKLSRFSKMNLKNMQDIGGCRAIVSNPKKLMPIVKVLSKRLEFIDEGGKIRFKDYINNPKEDGYRRYHLIGQFDDENNETKKIEIQLRTNLQHDWATALEIVDLFTGQALKSNQGDRRWESFFASISEQFALMDTIPRFHTLGLKRQYFAYLRELLKNEEMIKSCLIARSFATELEVSLKFANFTDSLEILESRLEIESLNGYVLVQIDLKSEPMKMKSKFFKREENQEAEKQYIEAEKSAAEDSNTVVALVSATAVGGIKEAYPNYFADSGEFIKYLAFMLNAPIHLLNAPIQEYKNNMRDLERAEKYSKGYRASNSEN